MGDNNTVNYTGVTIGPIYDTMMLSSTPGGLWGASYLFSWISKNLIENIMDKILRTGAFSDAESIAELFVSPYFEIKDGVVSLSFSDIEEAICEQMYERGVGLFHDRVIFCSDQIEEPLQIVKAAIFRLYETISKNLLGYKEEEKRQDEWISDYLRIYAINMDVPVEEAPILFLGQYLSAAELEPQFVSEETENRLLTIFENEKLKQSFLCKPLRKWILAKNTAEDGKVRIRDIQDICALGINQRDIKQKYQQYYVVLKSDGDSMGALLGELKTLGEIRAYSKKCLLFCAKAAGLILRYGGTPIYAGGDDLLALIPVMGLNPETGNNMSVLGLLEELRKLFNANFDADRQTHEGKPTLSVGLSIQYYKSPLYEALEKAENMLYMAKSGSKNACCINLQKHSGQSVLLVEEKLDRYDGTDQTNLLRRMDEMLVRTESVDPNESLTFLSGVGYQIEQFRTLFYQAVTNKEERAFILKNLSENLFDNSDQEKFKDYVGSIFSLAKQILDENEQNDDEDEKTYLERVLSQVEGMVRFLHFMKEDKEVDSE